MAALTLFGGCQSRSPEHVEARFDGRPDQEDRVGEAVGTAPKEVAAPVEPIDVSVDGIEGVIFPFGTGVSGDAAWAPPPSLTPSQRWTPTYALVEVFEKGFKAHLRSNPPEGATRLLREVDTYRRQYWSQSVGSQRILHVQLVCRAISDRTNWKERILNVRDGEDCFADVEFEVDAGKYGPITVHGGA